MTDQSDFERVGSCPRCGAPVMMPRLWEGTPPKAIRTCECPTYVYQWYPYYQQQQWWTNTPYVNTPYIINNPTGAVPQSPFINQPYTYNTGASSSVDTPITYTPSTYIPSSVNIPGVWLPTSNTEGSPYTSITATGTGTASGASGLYTITVIDPSTDQKKRTTANLP